MSMPDWGSLLQGFSQDPLGSLGQYGQQVASNAWQYTPQVANTAMYSNPVTGVPYGFAQGAAQGLSNYGQNLMGNPQQAQAQYGTQAQQPPQQPYNYGTNAGPNAYGYGSAPTQQPRAAGTPPMAGGATGTGTPSPYTNPAITPATGTAGSTGQNLNPAADFTNPASAVYAVLKGMGINTASSDPRIASLLQRGQDLVNQNIIPMIGSGQLSPTDMGAMAGAMKDLIQRAITNQPVFYGGAAGSNMLQQLLGAAAGGEGGSQSPENLRFLASIMDNPQAASALGSSLLYGGALPSAVSNVLGKPLAQAPTDWQILNATLPGGMPLPGQQGYASLLQRYLSGQFGPGMANQGGAPAAAPTGQ